MSQVFLPFVLMALMGCAIPVWRAIEPNVSPVRLEFPSSEGGQLVFTRPIPCPHGTGMLKGYDLNGNGDYDLLEMWRGNERVAAFQYDEATEQEVVTVFVQEGIQVVQYTWAGVQARYPSLCHLLDAPKAV